MLRKRKITFNRMYLLWNTQPQNHSYLYANWFIYVWVRHAACRSKVRQKEECNVNWVECWSRACCPGRYFPRIRLLGYLQIRYTVTRLVTGRGNPRLCEQPSHTMITDSGVTLLPLFGSLCRGSVPMMEPLEPLDTLYCTALHCTILNCTMLHGTVLYSNHYANPWDDWRFYGLKHKRENTLLGDSIYLFL